MSAIPGPVKCCFVGCDHRGIPEEGYHFFACPACIDQVEAACKAEYDRRIGQLQALRDFGLVEFD